MNINVVKRGSSLNANERGIDHTSIEAMADDLCNIGGLVLVVSGAVAIGRNRYVEHTGDTLIENKQNLKFYAGLGSTALFGAVSKAFLQRDRLSASYEITHSQLRLNSGFSDVLKYNAKKGVISIINEADAISQQELMLLLTGGDNDGLASRLAIITKATSLTLFTELGGIYDDDGRLISQITEDNYHNVLSMVNARGYSKTGRGGASAKIKAGYQASGEGIYTRISGVANGMAGENVTEFVVG